jgi:hypothetical protein
VEEVHPTAPAGRGWRNPSSAAVDEEGEGGGLADPHPLSEPSAGAREAGGGSDGPQAPPPSAAASSALADPARGGGAAGADVYTRLQTELFPQINFF